MNRILYLLSMLLLSAASVASQQISDGAMSGGQFAVQKTLIAGGAVGASEQFSVNSATGQALAGRTSSGGLFHVNSGFCVPEGRAMIGGVGMLVPDSGKVRPGLF